MLIAFRDNAFGFYDGKTYKYVTFLRLATAFFNDWIENHNLKNNYAALEREYWRILIESNEECVSQYGSEIDAGKVGSGFPKEGCAAAERFIMNLFEFV